MNFKDSIIQGDCLELIKKIPDKVINLIITSPPYFQQRHYTGNYQEIGNEKNLIDYIDKLMILFKDCVRVIKDDGHIVFNLGDKYNKGSLLLIPYNFAESVIKNNKIKLINIVTWVKKNPPPRPFQKRLVNATEPFFDFVKNDNYYYNKESFNQYHEKERGEKSNIGKSYFEIIEKSSLTVEQKAKAVNELKMAINEVKRGEITSFRMKINGYHAAPFGGKEGGWNQRIKSEGFMISKFLGRQMQKDVIECSGKVKGIKHPAVFPQEIIEKFISWTTRENDIVLDPFMGSGTTALACKKTNRHYIGFELNKTYIDYSLERLYGKEEN